MVVSDDVTWLDIANVVFVFFCRSTPVYFIWVQYLSWIKHGNDIIIRNQWLNIDAIGG